MSNKNRKQHHRQYQQPVGGSAGGGGIQPTAEPVDEALEAALASPVIQQAGPLESALWHTRQRSSLYKLEAAIQGVFYSDAEMIEYLEKRGYQVIASVQNLDEGDPDNLARIEPTPLAAGFEQLVFDEPDNFRVARQLGNGNIMVMVQLPEPYAEGVLSEAENQEITPGQFLDQRLQEALENYFISAPASR
jgi:hypothetical protein